jgi:ubiquitin
MNNKIMRLEDKKNNKIVGGGLFFNSDKSIKQQKFQELLKKGVKSESKLIDELKKYKDFVNQYDKIYKEHIRNLDKMDNYFQNDFE